MLDLDAVIITIGLIICVALLSHADVRITIKHVYPQPVDKVVDNPITQEEVDKEYDNANAISIDQILKDVQNIIGGDDNANQTT